MKSFKRFLISSISLLLFVCIFVFTGCKNDSESETYNFIAKIDNTTITEAYTYGSTVYSNHYGAVSIVLKNDSTKASFNWNLSKSNFKNSSEYVIKFTDLTIPGFNSAAVALELNWSDSSYPFAKFFNTKYKSFYSDLENQYLYLYLNSLTYDSYEIRFQFNHTGVESATNKCMYFGFTGIEPNGTISFNNLSIYEVT